ncbi:uncharacterized protein LTHEOB_3434 [Lasiodiplodia theobromae]|uniref:uncharacterized protein n=1 Tax=Lasiodiplodia theobromae TaxID=45133 RepID=UPI0015C34C37|nr:uncharacterized protein LTHEOB_3434 [Lasiodiplodia theobromae]KAF4533821.1 hypothetical protein LTHEOB_3434 [Lasiodiplodia theobromae]
MVTQVPSTFPEDATMRHGSEDSTDDNPSPFLSHTTNFHGLPDQHERKSGNLDPVDTVDELLREAFQKQPPQTDSDGAFHQKGFHGGAHIDKRSRFGSSSPPSERHLDLAQLNLSDHHAGGSSSSELQPPPIPSSSRSRASQKSLSLGSKHREGGVKQPRSSNTQALRKKRREKDRLHLPDARHQPKFPVFSRSTAAARRNEIAETEDDDDDDYSGGVPRTADIWPAGFQRRRPQQQQPIDTDADEDSLFVTPGPPSPPHHHHHHHRRRPAPTPRRARLPLPPPPAPQPPTNTTTHPDDNPTHRARLRAMATNPHAHPYVRKLAPEKDAENIEIKRLRTVERLHWEEIAARMNSARVAAGRSPTFTVAAVYGRFARVAPRIAEEEGDGGFDYRDYLNFRHPRRGDTARGEGAGPVLTGAEEEVLVRCYEEVDRERWVNVARKFKVVASVELTPEQVARKWKSL